MAEAEWKLRLAEMETRISSLEADVRALKSSNDMLQEKIDKKHDVKCVCQLLQEKNELQKLIQLERLQDMYGLFIEAVVSKLGAYLSPPVKDESPSRSDDEVSTAGENKWSDYWMNARFDEFILRVSQLQQGGNEDTIFKQKVGVGVHELERLVRRSSDQYYITQNAVHPLLALRRGALKPGATETSTYWPLDEAFFEVVEKDLIETGRGECWEDLTILKLLKSTLNPEEKEE